MGITDQVEHTSSQAYPNRTQSRPKDNPQTQAVAKTQTSPSAKEKGAKPLAGTIAHHVIPKAAVTS
jgi:hypothetical protein